MNSDFVFGYMLVHTQIKTQKENLNLEVTGAFIATLKCSVKENVLRCFVPIHHKL